MLLYIPCLLFIKSLHKYIRLPFTNLFVITWAIFMIIHILDITKSVDSNIINALYNIVDTMSKFINNVIIF